MNETQVREEIRFIQDMVEQTRKIMAGSWMYFLIWGFVAILGIAGQYVLVSLEMYSLIWLNWVGFMSIGVVFTMVYGRKQQKACGARTYSQVATAHIGFACGIGFALAGFVLPMLKLYTWDVIPVIISLIAGIFVFSLGGVYDWGLLRWCGAIWWLGAVGMAFIHANYRSLMFVPLILIGYIMPALVLRSMYRKQSDQDDS
jgi:hypothetical protein